MARNRSRKIDNLRWLGFRGEAAALSAGSSAVELVAAGPIPDTIMRTRGELVAYMDTTLAPGILVDVAVGFIIVPEGTGSTVLWAPITDPNAPWFFYSRFTLGYEEQVTDVIDAQGLTVYRQTIDSKAMRKSPPDTEIQMVTQNSTILSAGAVNVVAGGRILLGN